MKATEVYEKPVPRAWSIFLIRAYRILQATRKAVDMVRQMSLARCPSMLIYSSMDKTGGMMQYNTAQPPEMIR